MKDDDQQKIEEFQRLVAESCMQVMEMAEPVTEMVVAYRQKLEASGYSPAMAEQVAAHLHTTMLSKLLA